MTTNGTTWQYTSGDQLERDGSCTYGYDLEGRRETQTCGSAVTTLVWDAQDRLMSLTEPDGTVWRYTYDALDRRVRIAVDDGATVSVRAVSYDAKLAVALWSWDGSTWRVVEDYVVGAGFGEVLAKSTPSGPQYALRDHLQTPVAWVGADGTVSETLRDSYGVRADGSAGITVTEPYGYTGHAEDGHGLVWGRARWLDPQAGGWLAEDPAANEERYMYVGGTPVLASDDDGRMMGTPVYANRRHLCSVRTGAGVTGLVLTGGTAVAAVSLDVLAEYMDLVGGGSEVAQSTIQMQVTIEASMLLLATLGARDKLQEGFDDCFATGRSGAQSVAILEAWAETAIMAEAYIGVALYNYLRRQ